MKHWIFCLVIALAVPAGAQDKPKPEAAKEPAKEAAKPAAEEPRKQASASGKKQRRWNEDARHCLERPTTTEIIKCAEEYL